MEFAQILYVSMGLEQLDSLTIQVLEGMFENDGAANFTTEVYTKNGLDEPIDADKSIYDLKIPR